MEEKEKIKTEEKSSGRNQSGFGSCFRIETATCIKVAIAVFAVYLAINYWPQAAKFVIGIFEAATPLIIGAIIAFLVNILMSWLEKKIFPNAKKLKMLAIKRIMCMFLAFVLLLGIVALIVWLITPQLISCVEIIIAEVPPLFNKAVKWLQQTQILPEDIMKEIASIDWKSNFNKIFDILSSGIGSVFDIVVQTVTSVFSGVVTGVVSFIFAIYILLGKEMLAKQISRVEKCYLGLSKRKKFNHTLDTIRTSFEKFIVGQVKEAIILGVLCAVFMWIFGFPYATMIGALIGFTALIPVAGAYIGGAVGAIMILTESPVKAVLFVVFLVVLQQLEGNLIYPKVVGESIGLPGIWVLAAVTIGGGVMGIPGMLIGVPLVAAAYKLVGDDIDERLAARQAAKLAEAEEQTAPEAEPIIEPEPIPEPAKLPEAPKPAKAKKIKKKKK